MSLRKKIEEPTTTVPHSEGSDKDDGTQQQTGLSVGLTAFLLVALMAGAGFLALPKAFADTGWLGLPMMILFCGSVAFSGTRLGRCWVLLERRWPEVYRSNLRLPYPEIGYRAFGESGRKGTLAAVVVKLYGSSTVHLILMAEMLAHLVKETTDGCYITKCHALFIVAAFLIPLTWLGTPKDFWQTSVLAVVSTVVCILVVIVVIFVNQEDLPEHPSYPNPTVASFSRGFGAILFAFGGTAVFPTIQNDMSRRADFWKSVIISFSVILAMYIPVMAIGYIMYGADVNENILMDMEMSGWVGVAIVLEIINLLCTFIISSNPVSQSIEQFFNVPDRFGWRRCVTRTAMVSTQILVGLSVPDFSKILNLIGGSLITLCTFVLPPLYYMRLVDKGKDHPNTATWSLPTWERIFLIEIIIVGCIGGLLSTITAFYDIINSVLSSSCFTEFKACDD